MVRNLCSPTSGNAVANQFMVTTAHGIYFQSYETVIAKYGNNGKITLSSAWNYSNTTRKYLYQFLRRFGYVNLSANYVRKCLASKEFKYKESIKMA